jgi:hypothetical protein
MRGLGAFLGFVQTCFLSEHASELFLSPFQADKITDKAENQPLLGEEGASGPGHRSDHLDTMPGPEFSLNECNPQQFGQYGLDPRNLPQLAELVREGRNKDLPASLMVRQYAALRYTGCLSGCPSTLGYRDKRSRSI